MLWIYDFSGMDKRRAALDWNTVERQRGGLTESSAIQGAKSNHLAILGRNRNLVNWLLDGVSRNVHSLVSIKQVL